VKDATVSLQEITGSLEKILYTNEENHYTVAYLQPDQEKKQITIVGSLPSVQCGETLKLQGEWIHHHQFGQQFKIVQFESILPSSVTGLKKYLGSGLIKGVGPKFAERIVECFGTETLTVIDQFSGRLREVPGLGSKRAGLIRLAWVEQKAVRDIMIFLQSYGITSAQSTKIYKTYGENAMTLVREDPYRLARDIYGIGFRTADQIARNMGIPSDSSKRLQAGLLYQLEQMLQEGHTCFPHDELVRTAAADLLGVDEGPIEREIVQMAHFGLIKIEPQENLIFLPGIHHAEKGVAHRLRAIARSPIALPPIILEKALEWAESRSRIHMSDAQREAVIAGISSKITVITGGPGVGKTTIIRNIVQILSHKKARIFLCAPTGRAAKRLSESCSFFAQTIHRLLKYEAETHSFAFDDETPLNADLVVIDETSMLDVPLCYHLLKAIPKTASVIFVGDVDQLPSVGPGNVLRDIIESKIAKNIYLTQIFRQQHTSQIVVQAHRINEGKLPDHIFSPDEDASNTSAPSTSPSSPARPLNASTDFHFITVNSPEEAVRQIINLCREDIPRAFGFHPMDDIQVLIPMHRGICGVENLNRELQKMLNPKKGEPTFRLQNGEENPEIERFGRLYRTGDKVMQIKNNYEKDVFNGDLGRIISISKENQKIIARIDDREVEYEFTDLDELVPAYAITIHKSQGSEYPAVVIPVLTQHFMMLQKNLIYTAITRGKKLVVLVGTAKAMAIAVNQQKCTHRYGLLKKHLSEERMDPVAR
jgi:exodeoxyribonuclease V alpha subunit